MNTYFIRHTVKLDIDDETRRDLWQGRRIAIHYPYPKSGKLGPKDASSLNPDDYAASGRRALKALVELAKEGGYVCAQHHPEEKWMVGRVSKGSKIEIFKGKWGATEHEGRTAILKTLRLSKVKLVSPLDFAVLSVGRPRQGTITRWHLAGRRVETLVTGKRHTPQLSDLSFRQQEILCTEFLRLPATASFRLPRLSHLLLPTGLTMKDLDIIGIATDGKKLLAQVTFSKFADSTWKIDRLLTYRDAKRAHLVMFCDCDKQTEHQGVTIFPIRQAFKLFTSTRLGRVWLRNSG